MLSFVYTFYPYISDMKIFYVTATEFYRKFPEKYKKNIELIEKISGNKVEHFTSKQSQEFDYNTDQNELIKLTKDIEKALKHSDALIADITYSSAGPGYDIATALNLKKPVLVLKRVDDKSKRGPHPITVKQSNLLTYMRYNDSNQKEIIEDFITKAKEKLDTKFIFIVPAEIDRYLEWASDYKRMHKAQIVRTAIENYMEGDSDWKELLAEE